ncbi:DUF1080 domain-containing protein [Draconibacterium orientale]|uniref:3-keto-disaccharide hydrolase n=1 Tax=Draconibacterium orientale TaxID=1168034 RepID=UPI002ABE345E|nr:DUF1080 domain-containing protein [Draconibacterium orientale]
MRIITKIGIVLTALIVACSANNGFVPLFNGKNLDGWTIQLRKGGNGLEGKVFGVNNRGEVHVFQGLADRYQLGTGSDTHGMIWTNKEYSMFHFRFEYKWGKKICNNFHQFQYDAGCYYHVNDQEIWPKGIEYQIRYNHETNKNHTGDFWASSVDFQWYVNDNNEFLLPAEGGKPMAKRMGEHRAKSTDNYHALDDEWNSCEVIVMGDKYAIHKLNGEIVNYATDLGRSSGIIGLQSETAEIFYRNIEIKEFDEFVSVEKFLK